MSSMECLTLLGFGLSMWFGFGLLGWLYALTDKYIPDDHDCKA